MTCCAAGFGEAMKLELLRLATLIMQKAPGLLQDHRKELIKFGWNHLKRNDSPAKHHAFLNVCHFLNAYNAPEKIVLQVRHHSCLDASSHPALWTGLKPRSKKCW